MPSELPQGLDRDRHVRLEGRAGEPVARRMALLVLSAVSLLALANVFGQEATTSRATATAAQLEVEVPARVRGGIFFQGRVRVLARRRIEKPTLELAPGWAEEMHINTIEPAPESESARGGRLLLSYEPIEAGELLTVWMQFEVNPTGAGRRDQSVRLLDGSRPVAEVRRRVTVFP